MITETMRVCSVCGQEKHVLEFSYKDKEHRHLNKRCKRCTNDYVKRHYLENAAYRDRRLAASRAQPPKTREQSRKHSLKHRFGMTPEQYDALFERQGRGCGLCGAQSHGRLGNGRRAKGRWNLSSESWPVDHDHVTGIVRGLLCHTCNVRLGAYELLRDEIGFDKVAAYLARGQRDDEAAD